MQNRPSTRPIHHKAAEIKRAGRKMSLMQLAKAFGIITPSGLPNKRAVRWILDGYIPSSPDSLQRWGLLAPPNPPEIRDEPAHRVLMGAWKLHGCWVSPEEYFGA